jgi:D-xylonolactonase
MPTLHESTPQLELIADYACDTGENPLWHPVEKRLYWTDIPTGRLFRYDPAANHHEQIYHDRPVGGFTFQANGGLLLFRDRGNITLWHNGLFHQLLHEIPEERESRFNDVIADPAGRVFCGTMSSPQSKGRLYRLDLNGTLTPILDGIGCSNGMGFSLDLKTFYYTDSFAHQIYCFDYHPESGDLTSQRIFATIPESFGLPDGLAIDAEDRVWSALWDGSALIRYDNNGNIVERLHFPTRKVSSLTFAGDDRKDIYVTTAGGPTKADDGPLAGALLRLRLNLAGRPEFFSRIAIPPASR